MPTTALFMESLAAGSTSTALRTTAHQIVTCVSGRGITRIGDAEIRWERGDVLALPGWTAYQHGIDEDVEGEAVLFTVSDRPVMEKLGLPPRGARRLRPSYDATSRSSTTRADSR